jgi:hypothetical protein
VIPAFYPLLEGMMSLDITISGFSSPEEIAVHQRYRLTRLVAAAKRNSEGYQQGLQGICAEAIRL